MFLSDNTQLFLLWVEFLLTFRLTAHWSKGSFECSWIAAPISAFVVLSFHIQIGNLIFGVFAHNQSIKMLLFLFQLPLSVVPTLNIAFLQIPGYSLKKPLKIFRCTAIFLLTSWAITLIAAFITMLGGLAVLGGVNAGIERRNPYYRDRYY
jgi:hypothetical protein